MTYIGEYEIIKLSLRKEVTDMTVTELRKLLEQMEKEGRGDMEVMVEDLAAGSCVEIGEVVFDGEEVVCIEV